MKIIKHITILFCLYICTGLYCISQVPQQLPVEKKSQAEEYLQLIDKYHSQGNTTQEANYTTKLAYLYWENNLSSNAITYFLKALELNEAINNLNAIQAISTNLGTIYTDLGQYTKANNYFTNALQANRRLNRKQSVVGNLLNLANVQMLTNNYTQSITYLDEALELSKELNNMMLVRRCYGMLGEAYEKLGNSKKAIEYNDLFLTLDKYLKEEEMSQLQEETQQKINQAEAERRATEDELGRTSDELRETQDSLKQSLYEQELMKQLNKAIDAAYQEEQEKLRKEKYLRWIIIFGLVLVLGFSFVVYQQLQQKRKANLLLAQSNEEIIKQKREIEEQHNHISSGLRYAKTIQQAVLPIKKNIDKCLESFIIYLPKEIVSGDFYWFSRINGSSDKVFIAVADCTGHGVPGAFMSLIGNRLISELINERKMEDGADILENLNEAIKIALRQRETDNHDGMDLCLCKLERQPKDKTKITFCGAKRPLLYKRKDSEEVEVLKGDLKSLGGIMPEWDHTEFTNQEIILSKGDMIYLSSDGYVDQDSPDEVRLGTRRLLQIIPEISDLSVEKQKEELENRLAVFMNGNVQVDDITVMGIRI